MRRDRFRPVASAWPTNPVRIERSRDAPRVKRDADGCLDFARHERIWECLELTESRRSAPTLVDTEPVMVLGIAIGYASADFHRREGLVVQTVIREWMRNDEIGRAHVGTPVTN